MTLRELKERRAAVVAEMRSLHQTATAATRDFTAEERTRFDALKAENERLERQIADAEAVAEAERRMQGQTVQNGGYGDERFDAECRNFSLLRAIAGQVPDLNVDAGREREISQELQRRSGRAAQGIMVPISIFHERVEERVVTTAAPAGGPGGNLIATDFRGDLFIDRLRAALRVR